MEDEPDDEKRGWGAEGDWKGMPPQQQASKMAAGHKPHTWFWYDDKGVRHNFNYANYPGAALFSIFGNMSDKIKNRPEDWHAEGYLEKGLEGAFHMLSAITNVAAVSQFLDNIGASRSSEDPFKAQQRRLPKVFSSFLGGYIPRIGKDFDMWLNSETRKYEGFENFAKEVPFVQIGRAHV